MSYDLPGYGDVETWGGCRGPGDPRYEEPEDEPEQETAMSWKPVVQTDNSGNWYDNALRFATEEEAKRWAANLASRWMLVIAYGAHESTDPVNYAFTNDQLVPVTHKEAA